MMASQLRHNNLLTTCSIKNFIWLLWQHLIFVRGIKKTAQVCCVRLAIEPLYHSHLLSRYVVTCATLHDSAYCTTVAVTRQSIDVAHVFRSVPTFVLARPRPCCQNNVGTLKYIRLPVNHCLDWNMLWRYRQSCSGDVWLKYRHAGSVRHAAEGSAAFAVEES